MTPRGVLIITTPNVFKLKNIVHALFGLKPPRHPDHIIYFDLHTLKELIERYNFKIIEYTFTTEKTITNSIGNKIMIFLGSFIKQYNESLVVVCKQNLKRIS